MQENHPWEAILTNVQGTLNLINASENNFIERFVLVSTDKAVNPSNIMGATKHIAEKLVNTKSNVSNVKYMAVRFGNVIGSQEALYQHFKSKLKQVGQLQSQIQICSAILCQYQKLPN